MQRSLAHSKLPLGAKAKDPKSVEDYKFYRDMKDAKVFWDFRKVRWLTGLLVKLACWGVPHETSASC